MIKTKSLPISIAVILFITGCGNWNIRTGTSDITQSDTGFFDNNTRDIIGTEIDEDGNLRDCTRGRSSRRRDLPSCNEIVDRRKNSRTNQDKINDKLLSKKLSGINTFNLPNGLKIRAKSMVKYNTNTGELIINSQIERVTGNSSSFEDLFIESNSNIHISFMDKDDFELLKPLSLPLNILKGQSQNITYRKKIGSTIDDVIAIRIQARRYISSIKEYNKIARIAVSMSL